MSASIITIQLYAPSNVRYGASLRTTQESNNLLCDSYVQANGYAELASRAATSELEQLTEQVAHLRGLNGAATDNFDNMAEYGRGMSVFFEV